MSDLEMCTRCEDKVDPDEMIRLLDWKLCEVCQGDI
jgi:hypothetical protein